MTNNKELEVFATVLYEMIKDTQNYYYLGNLKTIEIVEDYIKSNKKTERVYNEMTEEYEQRFIGYRNEELAKVLEEIKKSLDLDSTLLDKEEEKVKNVFINPIKSIKSIVKKFGNIEDKKD